MRDVIKNILGAALTVLAIAAWELACCDARPGPDDCQPDAQLCVADTMAAVDCQVCSQTEMVGGCTPSRCEQRTDGRLCCVK